MVQVGLMFLPFATPDPKSIRLLSSVAYVLPSNVFSAFLLPHRLGIVRPTSLDLLDTLMERGVVSNKSRLVGRAFLMRGPQVGGRRRLRKGVLRRNVKPNFQRTTRQINDEDGTNPSLHILYA